MAVSSTIKLRFDGAAVQRGLAAIKKGFSNLNKSAGGFFTDLIGKTSKWVAILGPLAAGGLFAKFNMGSSETASNFEQMRMSFLMFTGSLEGAEKIMNQLRKVDLVSNLDLETLGEGSKMLMAYSVSAEDASSTVEKLSKISGGNADKFKSLALAFGQTTGAGILKGDDLKQYTENGWNPLQQIMAKTGETYLQVRKRMENHGVTLAEVNDALNQVTSGTGRFARAHELGSKTFLAATSRMASQWAQFKDAFGTPLNEHLIGIFDQITAKLPQMAAQAKVWGEEVGSFLTMIANAYNNGEVGTAIRDTFMMAVKMAGAELLAISTTAGEAFAQAAKGNIGKGLVKWLEDINPLRNEENFGPLIANARRGSESDAFKTKLNVGTYQENRDAAYQVTGFDSAKSAFQQTVARNQDRMVPMTPISKSGDPGYVSLAESMRKAVEELQKVAAEARLTNKHLAPQP